MSLRNITVKRSLTASDYMTLLPLVVGIAIWFLVKGVRYVPR